MLSEEKILNASDTEIANGYKYVKQQERFTCLFCEEQFEEGVIYKRDDQLLEAKKAIQYHVFDKHNNVFEHLIGMDKKYTGLSDIQTEVMNYFYLGKSDKEIAGLMGVSTSTIRNHRFKLREKEKQAKIFLALMSLMRKNQKNIENDQWLHIHKGAKMVDERYAATVVEGEKVLKTYFKDGLDGPLHTFPSKEKRKIIILKHILTRFDKGKEYTEREVNEVLKQIYPDFSTIRRYLIEYGFMDRNREGSKYWVKD